MLEATPFSQCTCSGSSRDTAMISIDSNYTNRYCCILILVRNCSPVLILSCYISGRVGGCWGLKSHLVHWSCYLRCPSTFVRFYMWAFSAFPSALNVLARSWVWYCSWPQRVCSQLVCTCTRELLLYTCWQPTEDRHGEVYVIVHCAKLVAPNASILHLACAEISEAMSSIKSFRKE